MTRQWCVAERDQREKSIAMMDNLNRVTKEYAVRINTKRPK